MLLPKWMRTIASALRVGRKLTLLVFEPDDLEMVINALEVLDPDTNSAAFRRDDLVAHLRQLHYKALGMGASYYRYGQHR